MKRGRWAGDGGRACAILQAIEGKQHCVGHRESIVHKGRAHSILPGTARYPSGALLLFFKGIFFHPPGELDKPRRLSSSNQPFLKLNSMAVQGKSMTFNLTQFGRTRTFEQISMLSFCLI